jgi:hypothetical protein
MEPMMNTTGWDYGFIALWGLHVFSVIAFFLGVLFFIIFAIKTFTPTQLKSWAIWLVVLGTVVCLVTVAIIGRPWIGQHYWNTGMSGMQMQRMNQMMEMMMEHNQGADGDDQAEHGDMLQMMRMMGLPSGTANDGSTPLQDEHHESSASSR